MEASLAHDPWLILGLHQEVELTPEWQTFSYEFEGRANATYPRVVFGLGLSSAVIEISFVGMPHTDTPVTHDVE